MRAHVLGLAALAAALGAPTALTAQERGAFVTRLGADTLAVEEYTRTATELRGQQVLRAPRSVHRLYTGSFGADGALRAFELVTHNISGAPGPAETRATLEFRGDTALMRVPRGDSVTTVRTAGAAGAVPWVMHTYALVEELARRARAVGDDSVALTAINLGASETSVVAVKRVGPNDYRMMIGGLGPWTATLDDAGRLVAVSGKGSTVQIATERVASLNVGAMGPAFAQRSLGTLSGRDTVRAAVRGAEVLVNYGRPSKRGRVIFGDLVPWGQVWRTGANAATQFRTAADLVIGGAAVPAGEYTLWTVPTPSGWTLVVNKKTKDERGNPLWGTMYDGTQDLVRVPLKVEALHTPVEQFTITLNPTRGRAAAILTMAWDRTQVSVEMAKK